MIFSWIILGLTAAIVGFVVFRMVRRDRRLENATASDILGPEVRAELEAELAEAQERQRKFDGILHQAALDAEIEFKQSDLDGEDPAL